MRVNGNISTSALICQLALAIKGEINAAFQSCGVNVTMEQWGVLKCLWEQEGLSQSEIAERVNKDKASVTRTLDIMARNDLIRRCSDAADRRSHAVILTDTGRSLQEVLRPAVHSANQAIYSNLNGEEREILHRLLQKIAAGLG